MLSSGYYLYLDPLKASYYSLDLNDVRNYIYADIYARFKRLSGRNVLFGASIDNNSFKTNNLVYKDSLNLNAFSSEAFEKYLEELKYLDISIDLSKVMLLNDKKYVEYVDKVFFKLLDNGLVKCENMDLIFDYNKIYHPFNVIKEGSKYYDFDYHQLKSLKKNVFYLDLKDYKNEIATELSSLNLIDKDKEELKKKIGFYQGLEFVFSTSIGKNFIFRMENVEHLFGLSYIIINPLKYNVDDYTNYDLDYLENSDILYAEFDVINYFNNYEIPVFLSLKQEEAIHLGIPSVSEEDEFFASQYNLPFLPIFDYVDDKRILVNSLFLNSYTDDIAHEVMIDKATRIDIATMFNDIKMDKLILSSSFKFGLPIPMTVDLKKTDIPLLYDNVNDLKLASNKVLGKEAVKDFFNPDFVSACQIEAFKVLDDNEFIDEEYSFTKEKLAIYRRVSRYVLTRSDISNIIWHIVLSTIFNSLGKEISFKHIDVLRELKDKNEKMIARENQNMVNVYELIKKYGPSIVRLYFVKNGFDKQIIDFDKIDNLEEEIDYLFEISSFLTEEDLLDDLLQGFFDEIVDDIKNTRYKDVYDKLFNIVDAIHSDQKVTLKNLKRIYLVYYLFFPSLTIIKAKETPLKNPIYYYSFE